MMSLRNAIVSTLIVVSGSIALADDASWESMFGYNMGQTVERPVRAKRTHRHVVTKKKKKAAKRVAAKPVTKPVAKQVAKPVAKKETPKATVRKVEIKTEPIERDEEQQPVAEAQTPDAPAKTVAKAVNPEAVARFNYVDPQHKIAAEPLKRALAFYAMNQHKIANSRYMGVIDYSKFSGQPRFCLVTMKSGDTECFKVAHGAGSDPSREGWARKFSNAANSHASSVGYYLTKSTYSGKHGTSLRLDGLSASNSNALDRAVVIHGAWYVNNGNRSAPGRSWGCPAVDDNLKSQVIAKLKGGALIYAWHPKYMTSAMK